jgi:hypothetical protein
VSGTLTAYATSASRDPPALRQPNPHAASARRIGTAKPRCTPGRAIIRSYQVLTFG